MFDTFIYIVGATVVGTVAFAIVCLFVLLLVHAYESFTFARLIFTYRNKYDPEVYKDYRSKPFKVRMQVLWKIYKVSFTREFDSIVVNRQYRITFPNKVTPYYPA